MNFKALSALLLVCILSGSCSKQRTISIPNKLADTEWSMRTPEGKIVLKFTSETECVYSEPSGDGESGPKVTRYEYEYRKPDLYITSLDADKRKIYGNIEQKDPMCIELQLYDEEGTAFFWAGKSVYYQHQ